MRMVGVVVSVVALCLLHAISSSTPLYLGFKAKAAWRASERDCKRTSLHLWRDEGRRGESPAIGFSAQCGWVGVCAAGVGAEVRWWRGVVLWVMALGKPK